MTTTTSTPAAVLQTALRYVREGRAILAAHDAEVDAWYRSGEGRSPRWITEVNDDGDVRQVNVGGSGYRFPECIHGASLWTDYDNICGGCEDGTRPDDYRLALDRAWSDYRRAHARIDSVTAVIRDHADLPHDLRQSLIEWAVSPLPKH